MEKTARELLLQLLQQETENQESQVLYTTYDLDVVTAEVATEQHLATDNNHSYTLNDNIEDEWRA